MTAAYLRADNSIASRAVEDFTRQRHISPNLEWRFDLIQISAPFHGNWRMFTHIRNAWQADDG